METLSPLMDLEKFWVMPTRPGPAFTETRTLTMTSNGRGILPVSSTSLGRMWVGDFFRFRKFLIAKNLQEVGVPHFPDGPRISTKYFCFNHFSDV